MIGALAGTLAGLGLGILFERGRRFRRTAATRLRAAADPRPVLPTTLESSGRELQLGLDAVRAMLGAHRAVLWNVRGGEDLVEPVLASGGDPGAPRRLAGDPIHWAWHEGTPLRLETAPAWASADATAAVVVPLEREGRDFALLTLDFVAAAQLPGLETLRLWGNYLRAFTRAELHERDADAGRLRSREIVRVLRRLPRDIALERFAQELAASARTLAGGTGAAVASWVEGSGKILAVAGEEGGPEVGATFGAQDSELGVSAHQQAPIRREHRRGHPDRLPIGTPGEQWAVEPRAAAVIPLVESGGGTLGAVAVWTTERDPLPDEGIEALGAVAPYAALQLRHAKEFGKLQENAQHDALTGLFNRGAFEERLMKEGSRSTRYERPLALLMVDIDHFKRVNDTYGHEAGDAVLRALAGVLSASLRKTDLAARFGGEEFVVLLPETGAAAAGELAERLRARIERMEVPWQGGVIPVRACVGVSACPECVSAPEKLVESADAMLYESKRSGRNRVTVAPLTRG